MLVAQAIAVDLQRTDGLAHRFFEGAPHRHRFADRLHLDRQLRRRLRELLEREPRPLHDAVVDRRLEAGGRFLCDVVGDLVERVPDGQQRSDLGDGKAGGLGGQGRASRDARVHLDHVELAVGGVDRELDVRAARLDADGPDDLERGVPHDLVFFVGERLGGSDGDAVARVDSHGVEVLDGADDNHVVLAVAHDLQLVLLPPDHRFFDEDLAIGAQTQTPLDIPLELLGVVGDVAAGAAEGVGRSNDGGKACLLDDFLGLFPGGGVSALGHLQADVEDRLFEQVAFLSLSDRLEVGPEHLDAVLLEHAAFGQGHRGVQAGLPTQRGQQAVGLLPLNDLLDHLRRDRLDIRPVRQLGVGHDGRRVAVDQDDLETLLAKGFAGLGA